LQFKYKVPLFKEPQWEPFEQKVFFLTLKYKNKYRSKIEDWQELVKKAQIYPEALEECRAGNRKYASQVIDLISD
jgi:hypothetical protein